jgi:hypothetical protein
MRSTSPSTWLRQRISLDLLFYSCFQGVRHRPRWLYIERRTVSGVKTDGREQLEGEFLDILLVVYCNLRLKSITTPCTGPTTTTDCRQDDHGSRQGRVSLKPAFEAITTLLLTGMKYGRRDGKLSFEEFTSMVANTDIIKSVLAFAFWLNATPFSLADSFSLWM